MADQPDMRKESVIWGDWDGRHIYLDTGGEEAARDNLILAEIEKSNVIPASVCHTPGIWKFPVFERGSYAPEWSEWFGPSALPNSIIIIGELSVNNSRYTKVGDIGELYAGAFCQKENIIYVQNDDNNPLWLYYRAAYNAITGFTNGKTRVVDGILYRSGLDYIPSISDEADNLEYGAMAFRNDNITLVNTMGEYDNAFQYFGNSIRIKAVTGDAVKGLYEYYIKNIKIKEDKATFVCGDKRGKLRQKIPAERFTREEFPKIKDDLVGAIKQDAYGECQWVRCVCVDELDVKEPDGETNKTYRTFYAARKITKIELVDDRDPDNPKPPEENYVWIKQTQENDSTGSQETWSVCPINEGKSDFSRGLFAVNIEYCMPSTWLDENVPEVFEVRACGVFNPQEKPLDIIKELLSYYCGIPYNEYNYKIGEIESEIGDSAPIEKRLAPIGIVYDKEQEIYKAIEQLQDASSYGFRFIANYNLFTARKDDNERPESGTIKLNEIVDIGQCEIDMNFDNYATIVDITYAKRWYTRDGESEEDTWKHYQGTRNRDSVLRQYGVDKTYPEKPTSYLISREDARGKAERLEKFFSKTRVMINNLSVLRHPDLRVYDIITVDLRIPVERKKELKQIAALFGSEYRESVIWGDWDGRHASLDFGEEAAQYRIFGGILKCKVMSVKLDTETKINTVSLLEVA
jgi:hypothetical protein